MNEREKINIRIQIMSQNILVCVISSIREKVKISKWNENCSISVYVLPETDWFLSLCTVEATACTGLILSRLNTA